MSGKSITHHRDTEHTEGAQRAEEPFDSLCSLCALCVSVVNAALQNTHSNFVLLLSDTFARLFIQNKRAISFAKT